jgi:hypothetical protein
MVTISKPATSFVIDVIVTVSRAHPKINVLPALPDNIITGSLTVERHANQNVSRVSHLTFALIVLWGGTVLYANITVVQVVYTGSVIKVTDIAFAKLIFMVTSVISAKKENMETCVKETVLTDVKIITVQETVNVMLANREHMEIIALDCVLKVVKMTAVHAVGNVQSVRRDSLEQNVIYALIVDTETSAIKIVRLPA